MKWTVVLLLRMGLILALLSGCRPIVRPSTAITPAPALTAEVSPAAEPSFDGTWTGAIAVMGQELNITVHLTTVDGATTATIDIPQQGATGLPLHDIKVALPQVHFELLEGSQLAVFEGEVLADGTVEGTFRQSGVEGIFYLARSETTGEEMGSVEPVVEDPADIYRDPTGLFTAPIPTNWQVQQAEGYAILTSPDEGMTVYLMAFAAEDLADAVAQGWAMVDPTFAYAVDEVIDEPAHRVDRAITVTYDLGDDEILIVIGGGWFYEGIAYVELFRSDLVTLQKRSSQLSIINSGFDILALAEIDLSTIAPLPLSDALLAELEAYIEEALVKYNVPGAAVAIVHDNEIVYAKGFGPRNSETGVPMTPETRMMVGSTSKTMTTMMMATLIDDGLMTWDTPVVEILPTFAVHDPGLTQQITVRNLVCACTGVPRRDFELIFHANELSAEDAIESLQSFEFFTDFGEAFQYSNQMVATGGYVAAVAAGGVYGDLYNGYEEAMQERILTPIGMVDTTLSFSDVVAGGNYAIPHGLNLGMDYYPIPLEMEHFVTPIAPAGAYWSTVLDMGRYLMTLMDEGIAPDGNRVVSAENLQVTWTPQISITVDASYGLGWIIGDYRGQPLIEHGGNTLGYTSDLAFLPQSRIGISILTNGRGTNFFNEGVRYRLLELLFAQEFEADESIIFGYERLQQAYGEVTDQITDTLDINRVAPYLGRFTNDALGPIAVSLDISEEALIVDAGEFRSAVYPRLDDEGELKDYIFYDMPMAGGTLTLETDETGNPIIVLGQGVIEYTFTQE